MWGALLLAFGMYVARGLAVVRRGCRRPAVLFGSTGEQPRSTTAVLLLLSGRAATLLHFRGTRCCAFENTFATINTLLFRVYGALYGHACIL